MLVSIQTAFGYPADIDLNLQDTPSNVGKFAKLAAAFLKVRGRYDVFHFNFGSSLIHAPNRGLIHAELGLYPRRAKLFVTYNGCDARQKFPTMKRAAIAACQDPTCYAGQCNSGRLDELRRRGIARMADHVEHMWAVNPDLLYFLPPEKSSFLPYVCVAGEESAPPDLTRRRLRVLHAPTNRAAKGSGHILAALERLRVERPDEIEVILVENLSHAEATARYREADLVVDQVLVGWYGGLAVEVMRMGKPVVARVARDDLHFLPPAMAADVQEAVIDADPSTILEVLRRCLDDRAWLARKAEAGAEYVRKWHDPRYVASLTRERYEAA